jgi:uncharacterized protein
MKSTVAIAALFFLFANVAMSQVAAPLSTISVSGSADVKVAPDEIYLRAGVETRHENLDEAKRQNDERIAKALASLRSKGVPGKNIQTDFLSVEPEYDNSVSRTRPQIYVVRKSIEVKLTAIESFESILTALLSSGVNAVHGIEFRTSQLRKHRDAARAAAIKAAREKADALAAELGVKRGKVYNISANDWGGWTNAAGWWGGRYGNAMAQNSIQNAGGGADAESTLSLGQITVSASVNVSFLIE